MIPRWEKAANWKLEKTFSFYVITVVIIFVIAIIVIIVIIAIFIIFVAINVIFFANTQVRQFFSCPEQLNRQSCHSPGVHKSFHPTIRDGSTWSKFGARGEDGDVFLFSCSFVDV